MLPRDDKLGRCYKLVVKHFSINKKPQGDVGKIQIPENVADEGGVDAVIGQVIQAAQDDANNLHSGVQLYAVFAYYLNDQTYTPRCWFRVSAEEEYDPETTANDPSEPATAQGLMSQLMRHNEAIMRTSVIQTSHVIQVLQQENASQRELLAKQAEQSIDAMAMIQETLDNATQRAIETKNAQMKQDIIAGVFEHLKLIIPVALNKLAGQKIAPETDASLHAAGRALRGHAQGAAGGVRLEVPEPRPGGSIRRVHRDLREAQGAAHLQGRRPQRQARHPQAVRQPQHSSRPRPRVERPPHEAHRGSRQDVQGHLQDALLQRPTATVHHPRVSDPGSKTPGRRPVDDPGRWPPREKARVTMPTKTDRLFKAILHFDQVDLPTLEQAIVNGHPTANTKDRLLDLRRMLSVIVRYIVLEDAEHHDVKLTPEHAVMPTTPPAQVPVQHFPASANPALGAPPMARAANVTVGPELNLGGGVALGTVMPTMPAEEPDPEPASTIQNRHQARRQLRRGASSRLEGSQARIPGRPGRRRHVHLQVRRRPIRPDRPRLPRVVTTWPRDLTSWESSATCSPCSSTPRVTKVKILEVPTNPGPGARRTSRPTSAAATRKLRAQINGAAADQATRYTATLKVNPEAAVLWVLAMDVV